MPHKFHVGESVILRPAISGNVPGGVYEVTMGTNSNIALKVQMKSMSALHGKAKARSRFGS
jgi:hypothetical protein